jgi:hypothetical protein
MKNRIYLLLLIIFFSPLIGHPNENLFFQINTGIISPLDYPTLSNYYNKGVIMSSGIGYIINNQLALIGRVSYTYFRFREYYPSIIPCFIHEGYIWNSWSEFGGIKVEKSYLLGMSVNLRASQFKTNGVLHPFISVGFGYLIQRIGIVEVTLRDYTLQIPGTGEFDNDFFFTFGAGTEVRVSKRLNFFVEGRLLMEGNLLMTSNPEHVYVPVEFGIRF